MMQIFAGYIGAILGFFLMMAVIILAGGFWYPLAAYSFHYWFG